MSIEKNCFFLLGINFCDLQVLAFIGITTVFQLSFVVVVAVVYLSTCNITTVPIDAFPGTRVITGISSFSSGATLSSYLPSKLCRLFQDYQTVEI